MPFKPQTSLPNIAFQRAVIKPFYKADCIGSLYILNEVAWTIYPVPARAHFKCKFREQFNLKQTSINTLMGI